MKRRDVIALLGAAAAGSVTLSAYAEQPRNVYRIGYLDQGFPTGPAGGSASARDGFLRGLREFGYEDGRNLVIEYRWVE